jgi:hypothetical protein
MRIYFAGPLFTVYEREYISKCAVTLREHGIDPFVPHEQPWTKDPGDLRSPAKKCLDKDFDGINGASAMLALVNGTEVDDGTACEIGIFSALMLSDPGKKGIVALHDDWRTGGIGEGKPLNAFVRGCVESVGVIVNDLESAIQQLLAWKAELSAQEGQQ